MKKVRTVLLAGLLVAALCVPVHAWEFAMTGNFQWNWDYLAQGGPNGFFGAQNVVNPALAAFIPNLSATAQAGLPFTYNANTSIPNWYAANTWAGYRQLTGTQMGLVSGLDANVSWMRMFLNPEIRVNPAVRIRGQYVIGGAQTYNGGSASFLDPGGNFFGKALGSDSDLGSGVYITQQTANGISFPISTGYWQMLWATAQTPWGILVFGKRPAPFGFGLAGDGEHTCSGESLSIVAPYGPLRIGIGVHPYRQGVFINSQLNVSASGGGQLGQVANNTTGTNYQKLWDNSNIRLQLPQMSFFVTYSNGPLDAGIIYQQWQNHQGPESAANIAAAGAPAGQQTLPTIDGNIEGGVAYVKYNNGRFFFNADLEWNRWDNRYQRAAVLPASIAGTFEQAALAGLGLGTVYQPVFDEDWSVATEFGMLCGPAKTSFLYAWIPGPDRRNGIWISKTSYPNVAFGVPTCNYLVFLPYSYLMTYTYAGGLGFRNAYGEGGIQDATVVATRLDYAVAANLNWYGSFIWAWRNSGGWPWGTLTIDAGAIGTLNGANAVQAFGISNQAGAAPQNAGGGIGAAIARAPNIPDNNLGWEITTGVDWKLLEGLTMNLRGAFWQPGEWFKYACLDRGVVTAPGVLASFHADLQPALADGIGIGSSWGVNPAKTIDPIWAFNGQLNVDF